LSVGAKHRQAVTSRTPRSKKVLELSLREALQLKHNYIGTEHILLGLLREGEGRAAQILVDKHPLDQIRGDVLTRIESPAARQAHGAGRTPAAHDVLALAAAGGGLLRCVVGGVLRTDLVRHLRQRWRRR
jgi:ATP-dependent Clp protease ATP-binding subunit ClpA